MTLIRGYEDKDFAGVLGLIHEFQAESLDAYNLFCDDGVAERVVQLCGKTSFVVEVDGKVQGVIGGMVTNYFLNRSPIYQEMIWYVTRKYRFVYGLKLLDMLEGWCQKNNIRQIIMVHMGNLKSEKLERFYGSQGYHLLETHYIKNL